MQRGVGPLNYSITKYAIYRFRFEAFIGEILAALFASGSIIFISLYNESGPNLRRRDGRVAEGARLESVFRGNSNVGSNPTLSATTLSC